MQESGAWCAARPHFLFTNDNPENVQRAKMVLFADDTNLLITGKDEFEKIIL
jgi:hypothetical protein